MLEFYYFIHLPFMKAGPSNIATDFAPGITHPLYLIRTNLLQAFRVQIPKLKGVMMDFGCGLKPYEPLFSVDQYIGVDFKGEGETYAQQKVDVFYDGKSIPFPNDHFDSIFCSEVFEHIFNLEEILVELHRVLKPGGKILISCPFAFGEHEVPNDFARYTSFAIQDLFKRHGFEIEHYEKTGSFIEALATLKLVYIDRHIIKPFRKIPVLRSVLRYLFFGLGNILALAGRKILPNSKELYLNNVLLAVKK